MAVRNFAGADSLIFLPGALNGVTPGPWTAAILWKRAMTAASPLITISPNATDSTNSFVTSFWSFISENAVNDPNAAFVDSTNTSITTADVVNADGWVILAITKATGTVAPRFHLRKLTAATTVRGNGMSALANGAAMDSTSRIEFGKDEYFNRLTGRVATAGLWNVALSDAHVDELWTSLRTQDWMANTGGVPLALWDFNQAAVTTAVADLMGGGATETARTGTTVVTDDDPPGWTFGVTPPPPDGGQYRFSRMRGTRF